MAMGKRRRDEQGIFWIPTANCLRVVDIPFTIG